MASDPTNDELKGKSHRLSQRSRSPADGPVAFVHRVASGTNWDFCDRGSREPWSPPRLSLAMTIFCAGRILWVLFLLFSARLEVFFFTFCCLSFAVQKRRSAAVEEEVCWNPSLLFALPAIFTARDERSGMKGSRCPTVLLLGAAFVMFHVFAPHVPSDHSPKCLQTIS